MTAPLRLLALAGAGAAALALTGCAQADDGDRRPITQVAVGDCFDTDEDYRLAFVVDCAEPHRYEAVHAVDLEPGAWPGDAALQEVVDAECPAAFTAYTGRELAADAEYVSQAFGPTEESWTERDDHRLVCIAAPADGEPVTGSAKGDATTAPAPDETAPAETGTETPAP
ncbi:MAG: hypothetical protein GXX90_04385 [Microbacteriaceae bacterium]|nr:hypothetical protein [Microbacteriaceae bacterium]